MPGNNQISALLAEDHPVNRKFLRLILKAVGVSTAVAADGLQAVEMGLAQRFDVFLFDLRMPGMSGLDAFLAIRSGEKNARTPGIALTAEDLEVTRANLLTAGFEAVIQKPFEPAEVILAVSALVASSRR